MDDMVPDVTKGMTFPPVGPFTLEEIEKRKNAAARKRDACTEPLAMLTYQQEIDWLCTQQERLNKLHPWRVGPDGKLYRVTPDGHRIPAEQWFETQPDK